MVGVDFILALVFYAVLYGLFFTFRHKFDVQNKFLIIYRTKIGIKWMDKIAKTFPTFLTGLSYISIGLGFLGMAFIFVYLFKGAFELLVKPAAQPIISPVLPGIATVPGAPILSFSHWIISLLVIVVVHEFFHGIYCRHHKVPVKASGFAMLGPLLGAFVEPDEKKFAKKKAFPQLAVLSAGAFANFLFAGIFIFILLSILTPIGQSSISFQGVQIASIQPDLPVAKSSLQPGMVLDAVDHQPISDQQSFVDLLKKHVPGDIISITANGTTSSVQLAANPTNASAPYLGVGVAPVKVVLNGIFLRLPFLYSGYLWVYQLFFWLFTISLGVGLFNLLPLGPIDGGEMFYVATLFFFKKEAKAKKIWLYVTLLCLVLIGINLFPFVWKFLSFVAQPLLALFA